MAVCIPAVYHPTPFLGCYLMHQIHKVEKTEKKKKYIYMTYEYVILHYAVKKLDKYNIGRGRCQKYKMSIISMFRVFF